MSRHRKYIEIICINNYNNRMDQNIKQKSKQLAAKLILLNKQLSARKKESVMSAELLKAGAGVGAGLVRSGYAMSKNDRIAKLYKALQDCAEAKYWLELLNETDSLTEFEYSDIFKECDEMEKLLILIIKSIGAASN